MRQQLKQYAASFAALAVLCLLGTVTVVLS